MAGPKRIAINGCGRIGRLALRLAWSQADAFTIVKLNDVAAVESVAYLIKYDSVHGTWGPSVSVEGSTLVIREGDRSVAVAYTKQSKPAELAWGDVDLVLECTGQFLTRATLQPYFTMGVKKVVVSAPVKDPNPVLNIVYGVNHDQYTGAEDIVTAASCTTNCLAPVVKVILEKVGIKHGCITTIHNITNTQTVVDAVNSKKDDLRRARSGMMNLAPTSTGSATAISLIFPQLKGKLNGLAVRVPLTNSSITDCVFEVERPTTVEEVNRLLKEASETYLSGIMGFEELPLVSMDYVNDSRSAIVDAACTQVINSTMVKIYAWYDNEWGYSARLVDVARMVAASLP
ncbi:glyceraldehyde 3-phosphate dehydrogenase [Haematococcus lacustris]